MQQKLFRHKIAGSGRRRILVALVMGWMFQMMAACIPAAATPAPLHRLAVCTSSANPTQMNVQFAFSEKIFAKYGLQAEVSEVAGGSDAAVALLAGDFAICQIAGSAVVNAVAAGGDLVMIGGVINRQPYYLVTRSDIKAPSDLVGQTLAVSGPGSSSDTATRAALAYFGLKPDQDVTILTIGKQNDRLAAMESGAIAGAMLAPPQAMLAAAQGGNLLLDLSDLNKPYQHTAIVTTRTFLKQSPTIAAAYLQATSEAVARMQANKPHTLSVMSRYLDLDPVQYAQPLDLTYDLIIQKQMNVKPLLPLPGIQALIDELKLENPKIATLKPTDLVDLSLVERLEAEGFFQKLQKPADE